MSQIYYFSNIPTFSKQKLLFLVVSVLAVCCKNKLREVNPVTISPKSEYLGSIGDKDQNIPILEQRKKSTPRDLLIKKVDFSAKEVGGNLYPHIKFAVNESTEAVRWQICSPVEGKCEDGMTTRAEIYVPKVYTGKLEAKICPCLYSSPSQEKALCGTCTTVETHIFQNRFDENINALVNE